MAFQSNPVIPDVPNEPYYGIERLWLFARHNRQTWEEQYGQQAPPWDKERRIKRWADTSVLAGIADPANTYVSYDVFDAADKKFKRLTLTVQEAATPNLPGEYVLPKWTPAATPAVVTGPGGEQPLNPEIICLKEEAEALAEELGVGTVVESNSFTMGPFRIEWRGEKRRLWNIKIGANLHSAARLLRWKHGLGIGAPGHWVISNDQPVWTPHRAETQEWDPRPEVPVPCRPLTEREALYVDPFQTVIYRTDKESPYNRQPVKAPAAQTGSPDTAGLLEILLRVDGNVQQLLALELTGK